QLFFDIHRIPLRGSIVYRATERGTKIIPVALVVVIQIGEFLREATQGVGKNREVLARLDNAQTDSDVLDPSHPLLPHARCTPEEDRSGDSSPGGRASKSCIVSIDSRRTAFCPVHICVHNDT